MNYRFYLRSNRPNKKGQSALYFIIEDARPIWVPTQLHLFKEEWDHDLQDISRHAGIVSKRKFTELQYKADLYKQSIEFENKAFSLRDFKLAVLTADLDQVNNPTLAFLISEYIDKKQMSYERSLHYQAFKTELQQLHPGIRIKEITYQFGSKLYKHYCENFTTNTATRKMKQLKAVVHYAIDLNIIKEDPLSKVKLKAFTSKKTFLTIAELQALQDLYDSAALNSYQLNVLRHFLFACYTGMRISDIIKFSVTMVTDDCIYFNQQKTEEPVIIPLSDFAKQLIQKPFDIRSGQYLNRELQSIAAAAGIKKHVTMHVGRHTFATVSLRLGMELITVSKILGHTSVKQTEAYLHLLEDHLKNQMNVWNNLKVVHKNVAG